MKPLLILAFPVGVKTLAVLTILCVAFGVIGAVVLRRRDGEQSSLVLIGNVVVLSIAAFLCYLTISTF